MKCFLMETKKKSLHSVVFGGKINNNNNNGKNVHGVYLLS